MTYRLRLASVFACLLLLSNSVAADGFLDKRKHKKLEEEKIEIREMRANTLRKLYELKPSVKEEVLNSKGVAVFSSLGVNVLLLSTARGGGIARNTETGEETFMRMLSLGGGVGMGVKDFRVVFVFHTETALNNFLHQGWDFSGQGDAAAEAAGQGASMEVAATVIDGVSMYQITENGLALQATLQGTKYYLDKDHHPSE